MQVENVHSPLTGKVWKLMVNLGQTVAVGDVLMVLESMKMEIPVEAPQGGLVAAIHAKEGDGVEEDQLLVVLEPN
jgi:biotin carboxyl carrier protein